MVYCNGLLCIMNVIRHQTHIHALMDIDVSLVRLLLHLIYYVGTAEEIKKNPN